MAVGDIELGLPERWSDLVFDDLDARARADNVLTDLDGFELSDIEA